MKKLSIAIAMLVLAIGVGVTSAQAGPGGSAGYPYSEQSAPVDASPNFSPVPTDGSTTNPVVHTQYYGNDGTVCRNLNLTCTGGHGPLGWYCQCPGFSGWWSAD